MPSYKIKLTSFDELKPLVENNSLEVTERTLDMSLVPDKQFEIRFRDNLASVKYPDVYFTNKIETYAVSTTNSHIRVLKPLKGGYYSFEELPFSLSENTEDSHLFNSRTGENSTRALRYKNIFKRLDVDIYDRPILKLRPKESKGDN